MAFDITQFDHAGGGFNAAPKNSSFFTADAQAVVQAAGYFNAAYAELKTGDSIYVSMSDTHKIYQVTVDKSAKTVTLSLELKFGIIT